MDWLNALLAPRSVAIVGASADKRKIRGRLLATLVGAGYAGKIFPVSASSTEVQGLKAYASLRDIGEPLDLAMIAVPAAQVGTVLDDCEVVGVGAVIVHLRPCCSGRAGRRHRRADFPVRRPHRHSRARSQFRGHLQCGRPRCRQLRAGRGDRGRRRRRMPGGCCQPCIAERATAFALYVCGTLGRGTGLSPCDHHRQRNRSRMPGDRRSAGCGGQIQCHHDVH